MCLRPEAENIFVSARFCHRICLNAAPETSLWKSLLQTQPVLARLSSLLGGCLVLGLLLQASLSLDTEAHVQTIPETFLSCLHILF